MTYSTLQSCPSPARFPVTTFTQVLKGSGQETTPLAKNFFRFLSVQSEMSWGRLVHLSNNNQRPFDVKLQWTGGGGIGNEIIITSAGGCAVFPVQAKTLTISIANWTLEDMQVHCSIENGAPTTMDLRRARIEETLTAATSQDFAIPRYAREVRATANVAALTTNIELRLVNQSGNVFTIFTGDEGFVPVDAATTLQIANTGGVDIDLYSLDFKLGYQ